MLKLKTNKRLKEVANNKGREKIKEIEYRLGKKVDDASE